MNQLSTDRPPLRKILVVASQFPGGFIGDDMEIIGEFGEAIPLEVWKWRTRKGKFWSLLRQFSVVLDYVRILLAHRIKVVLFYFAIPNYSPFLALIARLFGGKVWVITGGRDAVYVPEINWGDHARWWYRTSFGMLMGLAHVVLPSSENAKLIIESSYHPRRIRTAYPAVDTSFFHPKPESRRLRVTTVCVEYNASSVRLKGLDTFVRVASLLPEIEFVVVGNGIDETARSLAQSAPANVDFLPRFSSRIGYRDFLQTCSVYAQLSAYEGFGVSLAEAMATGCIPVVSDRGALPEVAGEDGFLVPYGNDRAAAKAVKEALESDMGLRSRIRDRVERLFDRRLRVKLLQEELSE